MAVSKKVDVVYYLCRNGQLEQPHFMEVPLTSSHGLYLKDVLTRLNLLRGNGMADLYSWSSKRSYKNGFVWCDLVENDFIYPAQGQEYVLKGSELIVDVSSISLPESDSPVITRRRNQSWSAIDLHQYKVYKAESPSETTAGRLAAENASTQTEDNRRRRRMIREIEEEKLNEISELNSDEVSPPPSDSSPETLETLMKADGKLVIQETAVAIPPARRLKASSVFMQLFSCGSIPFRDCGPGFGKNHPGLPFISQYYKGKLPLGTVENPTVSNERIKIEDKEYFSGSLIETKREKIPVLKRSSSHADRLVQTLNHN